MIGPLILLAYWTLAAGPENAPQLRQLITQHCEVCHDKTDALDLTDLPLSTDVPTWVKILDKVETFQMPPLDEDARSKGSAPPLSVKERIEMANAIIERIRDHIPDWPRSRVQLSLRDWLNVLYEVAGPWMSREEVKDVIAETDLGLLIGPGTELVAFPADHIPPVLQWTLGRTSENLCRRLSKGFLATMDGRLSDSVTPRNELIERTHLSVFRRVPTVEERSKDRALFNELTRLAPLKNEAWVGLCTFYLSGTRLMLSQATQ